MTSYGDEMKKRFLTECSEMEDAEIQAKYPLLSTPFPLEPAGSGARHRPQICHFSQAMFSHCLSLFLPE